MLMQELMNNSKDVGSTNLTGHPQHTKQKHETLGALAKSGNFKQTRNSK